MDTDALDSLFAVGSEQCEMLAAAARNPDADAAAVQRMALGYLLRTMRVEAADSKIPSAKRFRHAVGLFERLTRDVLLEAFNLTRDWHCASCNDTVAGRFFISEVRARTPAIRVECAACHALTDLSKTGYAAFRKAFKDNLAMAWNPRFNNFEWDGS